MGNKRLQQIVQAIEAGQYEQAHHLFEALKVEPQEAQLAAYLRALTNFQLGQISRALALFADATATDCPNDWWVNYGICARKAEAWETLALVTANLRRRGVGGYQSVALQAETARRDCDFEEAVRLFQQERQRGIRSLELEHAYANALRDAGQYQEALTVYHEALSTQEDPEIRWNKTLTELAIGKAGLKSFEHRFERSPPPYLEYTPTKLTRFSEAQDLRNKRLLLISEQGFGDSLQFARYAPALEKMSKSFAWVVPKRLKKLLSESFPGLTCIEHSQVDEAEWDGWTGLMSAPYLGIDEVEGPYLKAGHLPQHLQKFRGSVLINWAGSKTYIHDFWRSLTAEDFAELAAFDCETPLISIQHGLDAEARASLPTGIQALGHTIDTEGDGFLETASLLNVSKAFVTTDTSVAHLAGALGVKTHLILGPLADWRWEWENQTSPWYPTMVLHRWRKRSELAEIMASIWSVIRS